MSVESGSTNANDLNMVMLIKGHKGFGIPVRVRNIRGQGLQCSPYGESGYHGTATRERLNRRGPNNIEILSAEPRGNDGLGFCRGGSFRKTVDPTPPNANIRLFAQQGGGVGRAVNR